MFRRWLVTSVVSTQIILIASTCIYVVYLCSTLYEWSMYWKVRFTQTTVIENSCEHSILYMWMMQQNMIGCMNWWNLKMELVNFALPKMSIPILLLFAWKLSIAIPTSPILVQFQFNFNSEMNWPQPWKLQTFKKVQCTYYTLAFRFIGNTMTWHVRHSHRVNILKPTLSFRERISTKCCGYINF